MHRVSLAKIARPNIERRTGILDAPECFNVHRLNATARRPEAYWWLGLTLK